MNAKQLLCTFTVADKKYGVPVDIVQEVLANHQITDIPLSPAGIQGLMNIRGRIVPAIAMQRVLRVSSENHDDESINIIVNHDSEQVGLMVNRIGDIITVDENEIEPPPETLKGATRRFIHGVIPVQGTLFMLLDLDALLADELCSRSTGNAFSNVLQ
ncbi:MAG: chemotaxis protein CheW [Alcanivorax sp.]|nr:chemotaxis protein CheW [Alcanivorax sp.]